MWLVCRKSCFFDTELKVKESNKKGIAIENGCWIGNNEILDGVTLGRSLL